MDRTVARREVTSAPIDRSALVNLAILTLTAPFLLAAAFSSRTAVVAALVLLPSPYLYRLVHRKQLTRPAAANLPIALLALVLPASLLVSPAPWTITLPHVATLAWSIALYFAVINWPSPLGSGHKLRTRFNGPTRLYLLMGLLVSLAGLLGMRSVDKLFQVPLPGLLAAGLGYQPNLATNEIAGVLTLFIPFALALAYGCFASRRHRQLGILLPVLAIMVLALVLTQSRTGWAATFLGMIAVGIAAGVIGWKAGLIGLFAVSVAIFLLAQTPIFDWFVYAGASNWESVAGPRLDIWAQALAGIRDHPLWGMGFGAFGALAGRLYPLAPVGTATVLEDAHNFYLQTALDFGLAGLVLFLVAVVIVARTAVRLVRSRPSRSLSGLWAAGLLGALVAHALYSLTDAVALGTLAGVPLWFLFGMVIGAAIDRPDISQPAPARLFLGGCLLLAILLSLPMLPVNRAGQLAAKALLGDGSNAAEAAESIEPLAARNCRSFWYQGLLGHDSGDTHRRNESWARTLDCSDGYIRTMAILSPDAADLAGKAIQAWPDNSEGFFWLAQIIAKSEPAEAIDLYEKGLSLSPNDGRRWLALADLLVNVDKAAALDAYVMACLKGDPGSNGCLRAGSLAEAQGDPASAIGYYRLSKHEGVQSMAEELERRLTAQE